MKKFLTVLLVIAVMFTFSFGSAFAANDPTTTVSDQSAALNKITEAYNEAVSELDKQLAIVKANKADSDATVADWNLACQDAYDAVKAKLDGQLAMAYQEFGKQEEAAKKAGVGIKGYDYQTTAPADGQEDGYVYFVTAIAKIDLTAINDVAEWSGIAFTVTNAHKATYKTTLTKVMDLIKNYNIEQFAKDDKVDFDINGNGNGNTVTKSSYEWAAIAQNDAMAYLSTFKDSDDPTKPVSGGSPATDMTYADAIAAVKGVYQVVNAGTVGESYSGSFYEEKANVHPALSVLRTVTVMTTDKAKIDYVKSKVLANVKAAIESKRNQDLDKQNQILFAQSIAAKPDQNAIDKANEMIATINKNADAMLEVVTYRVENAEYRVVKNGAAENVVTEYDGKQYEGLVASTGIVATFKDGVLENTGLVKNFLVVDDINLTYEDAMKISEAVVELKNDAELLKAWVEVNGATAISVEDALKDATDVTYMTGNKVDLSASFTDTVVHCNAHNLLGTACTEYNVSAKAKVTVNGKTYDTLENWSSDGYSTNNTDVVDGIISDAKNAVKAAKSVEEANAAFLDAYEKYDAVITAAEQKALFNYSGALYGKDAAAKAELSAYIDYKVNLMGKDAPAGEATKGAIKAYFGVTGAEAYFLEEVVDEASLQTAIADVKAAVDGLKTKDALKAEADALVKDVNAVKRAVALSQRDDVLALYDRVVNFEDDCDMTAYPVTAVTASKALLKADIERLEDLELAELAAAKKALGTVAKLTLAQEEAVNAYVDAQDAYNGRYAKDYGAYRSALGTPVEYTDADAYADKIFDLKVAAAEKLIAVLPVNPTNAQISEAKAAVDALGFKGICAIRESLMTKLDKFTQDSKEDESAKIEALKITASSVAKKGSITVKWTVKGDAAAADGYQIWKSTKKSSGYKKAFTTTKKSYKNTKGLKKGTRYYYKVRAYKKVDGKMVYSDWSNKAYRKAK